MFCIKFTYVDLVNNKERKNVKTVAYEKVEI